MKIAIINKHREALRILKEASQNTPQIPKEANTAWKHFVTNDGYPGIVINQTGFIPTIEDNEEEVNGLCIMIALVEDKDNCPNAQKVLEDAFLTMMASFI